MLRRRTFAQLIVVFVIVSLTALPSAAAPTATSPTLGSADSFVILAATTVTNIPTSAISGDVGLTAAGSSYGGGLSMADMVTGTIYSFSAGGPAGEVVSPTLLTSAMAANTAAFGALSAVPNAACDITYSPDQDLVGLTLVPGVYCFPTTAKLTTGVALTLDGAGDPAATWIFRVASGLNTTPGVGATVIVTNSGSACNVWWQVGSSATIGSGTNFIGNILAFTSISLGTGADLEGRALAQTGAVTLDQNTITRPSCAPTAVELLYFQADPLIGQQVQLKWATAVEVDNFGFNVYRANENDLTYASLIHFEPAVTQGSGSGATYVYVDTAPYAGPWWYWLSDIDTRGRETFHAMPTTINVQSSSLLYHVYCPFIVRSGN